MRSPEIVFNIKGNDYRLVVAVDAENISGINVSISQGDEFPTTTLNSYGTSRVTLDFAPESTGEVMVEVSGSTFSDTATNVTVSLEPVQ